MTYGIIKMSKDNKHYFKKEVVNMKNFDNATMKQVLEGIKKITNNRVVLFGGRNGIEWWCDDSHIDTFETMTELIHMFKLILNDYYAL